MYEWLEQEIAAVKTRKFFLIEGCDSGSSVGVKLDQFPRSYVEFLRKFGKAEFFRENANCYTIGILGNPRRVSVDDDGYWDIGWYNESRVLMKELQESAGRDEWPVYEQSAHGQMRRFADSFEEWLKRRWQSAKARYSDRKWKKLLQGPEPFSPDELEIVKAHKDFRWRLLEVDENCGMRFEVFNGSNRRLPYIEIGIHGARRGVWFAFVLRVDHILPGKQAIVECNPVPPGMLDPDEIELFQRPEAEPEDREFFSEFLPFPARLEEN